MATSSKATTPSAVRIVVIGAKMYRPIMSLALSTGAGILKRCGVAYPLKGNISTG
ncbi:MAG: hypothetical protein WCG99_03650 [Candidatus Berkelbacteria bacterium]